MSKCIKHCILYSRDRTLAYCSVVIIACFAVVKYARKKDSGVAVMATDQRRMSVGIPGIVYELTCAWRDHLTSSGVI